MMKKENQMNDQLILRLGRLIKLKRELKGKVQKELAYYLKCSIAQISYLELGARGISIEKLFMLNEFFDKTLLTSHNIRFIMGEENEPDFIIPKKKGK